MTMAVLARSGPGEASPPQRDVIRMTDASRSVCKLGLEGIGLRWQTHAREAQALLSLDSLHRTVAVALLCGEQVMWGCCSADRICKLIF